MKRTNTFAVRPLSEDGEQLLRDLLDASAALWNEVNYERLMRYNDEHSFEDEDVWDADTGRLEGQYKGILGASTAQQVIRKNSEAWRAFFRTKDKYHDESDTSVTEHPEPPGFWGNKDDGRKLHTVIRNTSYTVEWGDRSRLEILVGDELKDRYDHTGRLRLEIAGEPNWPEYESQGRLDLWYDETDSTFRASQPVTVSDETRDTPLADETAALDIGANNLVACTTTTGEQYLYDGSRPFEQFRETSDRIAELTSKLDDQRRTSARIDGEVCGPLPSGWTDTVVRNFVPPCRNKKRVSVRDTPTLPVGAENRYERPYERGRLLDEAHRRKHWTESATHD